MCTTMSYKRVTKGKARKLYNKGCTIHLLPCRVSQVALYHTDNSFVQPLSISLNKCYRDFDKLVNEYEYYNCTDTTMGKHTNFYVDTVEFEKSKSE